MLFLLLIAGAAWAQDNPKPLETLEVGDRTYSNVTLRFATTEKVGIRHSAGIKSIPLIELTLDQMKALNETNPAAKIDLSKVDPNPPSREALATAGDWISQAGGVNGRFPDGNTPLIRAVLTGDLGFVKAVLSRKPNLNATSSSGGTAWREAAARGYGEIAAYLEKAGAKVPDIFSAAQKGEIGTLELFLVKDPATGTQTNAQGHAILTIAVRAGQTNAVEWLIDRGVDLEAADSAGKTALVHAVEQGNYGTAELLVEKGADVNARDEAGITPLIAAAKAGSTNLVRALLDRGARIRSADRNAGWNALMHAVNERQTETVKLLLEQGAKPDQIDRQGRSAISMAQAKGEAEIGALLTEAQLALERNRQEKHRSLRRVMGEELAVRGEGAARHSTLPDYLPYLLWSGLILAAIGNFWLVIMGFHETVQWGIAMFFLGPIAGFIYYRTKSLQAVWPLLVFLSGFLMLAIPALLFQLNLVDYFLKR